MNNQTNPSINNKLEVNKNTQLFDNLELWTYQDLSRATKIPVSYLQKMVCYGRLKPIKIGRLVRFDPKETIEILKKGVS